MAIAFEGKYKQVHRLFFDGMDIKYLFVFKKKYLI